MHSLRTSRHLLQLVQKSALPEMSGRCSGTLAGKASPGTSSDALRPCGFHASSSPGSLGAAEQEGPLRSPVPHQCRNPSRSRTRSPASRCGDRLLQRAAQLESKTRISPACPLRRTGRWAICRWHALDQATLRFLSSRRGAWRCLPRQVPRSTQACLSGRQAQLSWRLEASRAAENLCGVAQTTLPKGLGGLRKASVRRPRACAPLSGSLYPSRGHLQPPPGRVCRRKGHLSLARFHPQQRTETAFSSGRRVLAPLSVAFTPGRFRAHPKLRIPGQSQTCHNLAALLSVARLYATTPSRRNPCQFERCLALPQLWWADAGHRKAYCCGDPAPFSAVLGCRRRMKRTSTSRNPSLLPLATSLCVFLSDHSSFLTPQGHPYRTTFALSATLPLSLGCFALPCLSGLTPNLLFIN